MSTKKGFFKALFFVLIALFAVKFLSVTNEPSNRTLTPPLAVKVSSSPKPSPSPTPTPVPSPTPNYGYCLYAPVIYYHHIQPQKTAAANNQSSESVDTDYFERQMAYLRQNGYTGLTALELVQAVRNHTSLPSKSIVVSLDDGYADQYTYAFPVAQKYGIKLNLLISSGLINNPGFMTWDQVNQIKNSGGYIIDHTWSHNSINYSSLDKIKYEIETARTQIEQNTGQKVDIFGYPYGGFNNLSIAVLNEDGFLGAFSTVGGYYQCESFIMALHRTRIGNAPLTSYGL